MSALPLFVSWLLFRHHGINCGYDGQDLRQVQRWEKSSWRGHTLNGSIIDPQIIWLQFSLEPGLADANIGRSRLLGPSFLEEKKRKKSTQPGQFSPIMPPLLLMIRHLTYKVLGENELTDCLPLPYIYSRVLVSIGTTDALAPNQRQEIRCTNAD